MNKGKYYTEHCVGCGLCHSVNGTQFTLNKKGFMEPDIRDTRLQEKVCPVNGFSTDEYYYNNIWGPKLNSYIGWSSNKKIRTKASSGGGITAIACYLLDSRKVDMIIHVTADPNNPLKTVTKYSSTPEEVISACGSRYAESAPLNNICEYLNKDKTYALIGKPCDIQVIQKYLEINKKLQGRILYMLSFFCAGVPSYNANKHLVKTMGCNEIIPKSFNYRGNGWPGYAIAVDSQGQIYKQDYNSSWGKVLGRDKRKMCRLCTDGIGLFADLVFSDAWYKTKDNKPDFSEHEGRNIIFSRTQKGEILLQEAYSKGYINLEVDSQIENDLKYIQKYQFERRVTFLSQLLALKITFHQIPKFNYGSIKKHFLMVPIKVHFSMFWGTLKRIYRGRYD